MTFFLILLLSYHLIFLKLHVNLLEVYLIGRIAKVRYYNVFNIDTPFFFLLCGEISCDYELMT